MGIPAKALVAARRGGLLAVALFAAGVALAARETGPRSAPKEVPPVPPTRVAQAPSDPAPGGEEPVPPADPDEPGQDDPGREEGEDDFGSSPGYGGSWYGDVVRRAPPPIPPARPLPYYPPEPPPMAPPGSAISYPPDFVGSAQGYLEIPVGQTATLLIRDAAQAGARDEKVARVVAREKDRVLVRGVFPGRTLLDVWVGSAQQVYVVRVR